MIVATLWLGEPVTLTLVAAIALVLGGVAIGTWERAGPERAAAPRAT